MATRLPLAVPPLEPSPEQAPVHEHDRGPLLVTGPPGSGKTALLRERFARLVEGGADPERVALLVLSRRAARDAREHLVRRLGRSLPGLPVFTAHAFAFGVVSRRFEDLGYREPPRVLSAPEQYAVVRDMLGAEDIAAWPRFGALLRVVTFAQQVADFVLRAQERLLGAGDLGALVEGGGREDYREVAIFYRRYLEAQVTSGRTDFAGLLAQTVDLLRRDLSPAEAFGHVLVDDYQDVTHAAEGIVGALAGAAASVTVAADPAGHVFAYRGGSREPLDRIGDTLPGLRRVELEGSHRRGIAPAAVRALDGPDPGEPPSAPGAEALAYAHPGEEADAAAHELVRARVEDDVPWDRMAVIVRRYGPYLTELRHALARHEVPFVVVAEAAAVATEPANRPMIDLFRYVVRAESRAELLERLLLSPVAGLDPHALRRLRREARLRGVALLDIVTAPPEDLPGDLAGPVRAFGSLVRDLEARAVDLGPDALFFHAWSRLPHVRTLVGAEDRQRDLDALAALGDVLGRFVERRPDATIADYLDTLDAAEFGPDPWIPPEERRPQAVRVVSAHRAQGMEFDVVVVVGCLEGEFPSLGHGPPLVDLDSLISPRTPRQRVAENLAAERALFRLAVSRGRRRTVLLASHSASARNPRTPSRFAARMGLRWREPPEGVAPGISLRTVEASLRRRVADPVAPRPERLAALVALAEAGAEPRAWWGGRGWTDPGDPLHPGEIRTSYSRLATLQNCGLQYLYGVEMGLDPEKSHAMWLGSFIHGLIDRVQRGEIPREEGAMLTALEEGWRPEAFPNGAVERQRRVDAERMVRLWLADDIVRASPILDSEVGFEYPLDGAVIRGRIDAILGMGEGAARVIDYKTGRYPPTGDQVQEDLQLAAYFLAMRRDPELRALGEPRILELGFLALEGAEGFKHLSVNPERTGLREYEGWAERSILELLELVRAERYAPSPEAECRFCAFKPLCPLWPESAEVPT